MRTSLNCNECRHEGDENLPKSACKICENLNAFSPKEAPEPKPRHEEILNTTLLKEEL